MKQRERGKINFNFKNKKLKNGFTITISIIAILAIIYFISEDIFISITAHIVAVILPPLTIFFIISPFIYIKNKNLKFNIKNIIIAIIITIIFALIARKLWELFLIFIFKQIAKGFLSTF